MMKTINRSLYFAYYLKELDRNRFNKFLTYVKQMNNWSSTYIWSDIIKSIFKYNISIMDYFIFSFFEKSAAERNKWAGTGYMYEYHLKMNPKNTRHLLADKIEFYKAYAPFVNHSNCTIDDLKQNNNQAQFVINNTKGKIVVKDSFGQCGWNVKVLEANEYTRETLISYMTAKKFNLAEEFIQQHADLSKISSSGLNTVRIITQLNKRDLVEILGARLRITVNSHVDNLASGNIAAPINLDTGKVYGVGVYSDITKADVTVHPITGVTITGFQIPLWEQVVELAKNAALHRPENRSIGWDVAITDAGPELIEGNHNWCKILWQLPVKKGLKKTLYKYL
jgi:hypothetical protein